MQQLLVDGRQDAAGHEESAATPSNCLTCLGGLRPLRDEDAAEE